LDFTRRDLGKLALAAWPASRLLEAKPNSNFGGVQVGVITYSYRSMPGANDAKELLKYIVDSGVSGIELMGPAAEIYAGSPAGAGRGPGGGGGGQGRAPGAPGAGGGGQGRGQGGGGGRQQMTPEQQAAQRSRAEELKKWRLSVPMDKYKEMRKMYNDAGVSIYAFKLEPQPSMSDEEYEYIFHVADTLGANHVTLELSNNMEFTKRIGDSEALLSTYKPGTFFGEPSILLDSPYVASAWALTACRVFRLSAKDFWSMDHHSNATER